MLIRNVALVKNVLKRGSNWLNYLSLSGQATKEVPLDGAIQAAEDNH